MKVNKIYNEKYETGLQKIHDKSIDFVCIDPPYTDGKKDVLVGHKIQTKIDISHVMSEAYRVLKDNSFFAVFGQMPTIIAWYNEAIKAGFKWKQDIVWAKRMVTSPYAEIQRTHEYIYVFTKGKSKFFNTHEKYEDLKVPALHFGLYELSTIKTTISDLQRRLIDRKYDELYYSKKPTANGRRNDIFHEKTFGTITKSRQKDDLDFYCDENNLEKPHRIINLDCQNNHKKIDNKTNDEIYSTECYGRSENNKSFRYRSKWYNNITNLWSFLPENQTKFGYYGTNIKHPTVKPIKLLNRLIKLCTPEPTETHTPIILDFFLGSGTTAISAVNTGRNYIGFEIDKDYFEISEKRIKQAEANQKSKLF